MGKTLKTIGLNLVLAAVTLGSANIVLTGVKAALAIAAVVGASVVQVQRAKARARKAANILGQQGLKEEVRSPKAARGYVVGRARVAGVMAFAGTHGTDNSILTMVFLVSASTITSFEKWFVGDEEVTLDGSGNVTTGRYAGKIKIVSRLGNHLGALPLSNPEWTTNHKCLGIAHYGVEYTWDPEVFTNGRPRVNCIVKGAPLYDPRKDSTVPGGSGLHRDNDETTWEWSNNWALVLLDYLKRDPLGCRVPISEIPLSYVITAANVCDEAVNLKAGGSQVRYTADGMISSLPAREDNLTSILPSGAGELIWQGGGYQMYAGSASTAVVQLGDDDLRAPISINTRLPTEAQINRVTGRFVDSTNDLYEINDYPVWASSSAETEDGGEIFELPLDLPFTQDGIRAQRIAKIFFEEARRQISVSYPAKMKALQLQAWSTMKLSNARWGFVDKQFRVVSWQLSSDGGVDLELQEYDANIYAWNEVTDEGTVQAPASPTIEDGTTAVAVAGLSAVEVILTSPDGNKVPVIEVTWTVPSNVVKETVIQYRKNGTTDWTTVNVEPDNANARVVITAVVPGVAYDVQVYHVTWMGVISNPKAQVLNIAMTSGENVIPWSDIAYAPADLQNWASNPNFEGGSTAGWIIASGSTVVNTGYPASSPSDYVLQLGPSGGTFRANYFTPSIAGERIAVSPGDMVYMAAMFSYATASTPNGSVALHFQFFDKSGSSLLSTQTVVDTSKLTADAWTLVTASREAPAGSADVRVSIGNNAAHTLNNYYAANVYAGRAEYNSTNNADALKGPLVLDGVTIEQSSGGDARILTQGMAGSSAFDTDVFTFDPTRESTPLIIWGSGGLSESNTLTAPVWQNFQALLLTTSGFTASLRLSEAAGSLTLRTETGATTGGTYDFEMNKDETNDQAFDDNYDIQADIRVNAAIGFPEPVVSMVEVAYLANNGAGWVEKATKQFTNADDTGSKDFLNNHQVINHDGMDLNDDWAIDVKSTFGNGGSILAFDNVVYESGSVAPSDETATPTGVSAVDFEIKSGEEGTIT